MANGIKNLITSIINWLGDWNHAFVVVVVFYPTAFLFQLAGFSADQSYVLSSILWIFGYYMKEHGSSRPVNNLTELQSLNPFNWPEHDRKQTIYLTIVSVSMAILNTSVIPAFQSI